jgi:hypothetical protein
MVSIVFLKRPNNILSAGIPQLNYSSPQAKGLLGLWPFTYRTGSIPQSAGSIQSNWLELTKLQQNAILTEDSTTVRFSEWRSNEFGITPFQSGSVTTTFDWELPLEENLTFTPNVDSFTIFGWFYWLEGSGTYVLFRDHSATGGTIVYQSGTDVRLRVGATETTLGPNTFFDKWHHFVVVSTPAQANLYIDGIKFGEGPVPGSDGISEPFHILKNGSNDSNFSGSGSAMHFGFVDHAWTEAEVWSAYRPESRWDLYFKPKLLIPVKKSVQNIEGSLHTETDTLYHGQLDLDITGSLFSDSDTLFHGLIEPIAISGSLFQDADDLFHGQIDLDIAGSLFTDSDTLYHGQLDLDITGSLFTDADVLYHGEISAAGVLQDTEGSLFQDPDVLYHGLVSPHNIFGSTLEDDDQLFHGDFNLTISGSLLQDIDTLNRGLMIYNILPSILINANVLYHGNITENISGSLFEDSDSLFHGATINLPLSLLGSLFADSDTLYHGSLAESIRGSLFQDADILNHGFITHELLGQFLQNTNVFFRGDVYPSQIFGSLLQDPDIFYDGTMGEITFTDYFIAIEDNITGLGVFSDLADEITLQEQGASAEGTLYLGIDVKRDTV